MNSDFFHIFDYLGFQFWGKIPKGEKRLEVFTGPDLRSFIFNADNPSEAKEFAREWISSLD